MGKGEAGPRGRSDRTWGHWRWRPGRGHFHQVTQSHPSSVYLPTPESEWITHFASRNIPKSILHQHPRDLSGEGTQVICEYILILLKKKKKVQVRGSLNDTHTSNTHFFRGRAVSLSCSSSSPFIHFQDSQKCGLWVVFIFTHRCDTPQLFLSRSRRNLPREEREPRKKFLSTAPRSLLNYLRKRCSYLARKKKKSLLKMGFKSKRK